MAEEKQVTGQGGPESAEPQSQPDNVVTDNTGVIPVQPVATTDPTLTDNTNPKIPFDGSDPRNIPPHDSNEQLHISASKRMGAELSTLTTTEDDRRKAVDAAYDNSQDVRDVVGSDDGDQTPSPQERIDAGQAAIKRAQAQAGNRAQPPSGRAPKPSVNTKG